MITTITLHPCIDKTFSVDRVAADRKLDGYDVQVFPGGGGLNAARVIRRLGGQVVALWTGAERPTAELLAELLEREEVEHAPLPVAGDVRENLIITDASTGEQYRFGTPGPQLSEAERAGWLRHARDRCRDASYAIVSGSLPPKAPTDWYGALLEAAADAGTRVVVDTKKEALSAAFETGVYLAKPNARELADVVGRELDGDDDIEAAGLELIERGAVEVLLVSLGRAGAMVVTNEGAEHIGAPSVQKRSKVGAGDSLVGAAVLALDRGQPVGDAAPFGVAAGAAAVMTGGTELCHAADVERLYRSVQRRSRR